MNAYQNSKFEMFERAIKVCNDNPTKVALNPAFQEDKELAGIRSCLILSSTLRPTNGGAGVVL